MNKLVQALVASTLGVGAAALYYHHALQDARTRFERAEARELPAATPADKSVMPVAATTSNMSPELHGYGQRFLAKYDDPERRGELLTKAQLRSRRDLEGFDKERGIDTAKWEQLVRLHAEFNLTMEAAYLRCAIDPHCNRAPDGGEWDRYMDAVDSLIGQGGYDHVKSWTQSLPARRMVSSLSSHLPVPLTTDESNALLDAVATERSLYVHGYSDSRQRFMPFVGQRGMEVLYSIQASTVEERMASARDYSRRIRGLAATVLDSGQLRTFNKLQDDALGELQGQLHAYGSRRNQGS